MPSYMILIKYNHEGAQLDSCLDISQLTRHGNVKNAVNVQKIKRLFGAAGDADVDQLLHSASMLHLRTRFDGACDGPYVIHAELPLTREHIERLLNDPRILSRIRTKEYTRGRRQRQD